MDDPAWVSTLVDRVVDHIIEIGIESLRKWELLAIQINDDVAGNFGPVVGPNIYERIFLPLLRKMVNAYREAGARFIRAPGGWKCPASPGHVDRCRHPRHQPGRVSLRN